MKLRFILLAAFLATNSQRVVKAAPTNDEKNHDLKLSGRVIIQRKTKEKLIEEDKDSDEIASILSEGTSQITKMNIVYEFGGESDGENLYQVVDVGKGHEKAFIEKLTQGANKDIYELVEPDYIVFSESQYRGTGRALTHLSSGFNSPLPRDQSHRSLMTPTTPWSNDPFRKYQYHHTLMENYQAWEITTGSPDVTIGICGDGIKLDHPDLAGNRLAGYNAVTQKYENEGGDVELKVGFGVGGMWQAGLAAAIGNNEEGISGVGWNFKHRPGVVTDENGNVSITQIADCIR